MNSKASIENLKKLEVTANRIGIDLVSSAAVGQELKKNFHPSISDLASSLGYAIVLGIRLSQPVLDTLTDAPTWTYYHHYRTVNLSLDQAALRLSGECRRMGYSALPVPASQILDWVRLRGHLSHKEIGAMAGLGWRGRNNLLVNPEHGAQVRYVTVLTDMPLPGSGGELVDGDCGDCRACLSVCPAGAIHESPGDFDVDRCTAQLRRFSKSEKLNVLICGLCVRACRGKGKSKGAGGKA